MSRLNLHNPEESQKGPPDQSQAKSLFLEGDHGFWKEFSPLDDNFDSAVQRANFSSARALLLE